MLPSVRFFLSIAGPGIVDCGGQQFRSEAEEILIWLVGKEAGENRSPKLTEVLHVRMPCALPIANVHLDATGVPDPAMKEPHSFNDGSYKFKFAFKAAVDELATCIPM